MMNSQPDFLYRSENLAWAWGQPQMKARFKACPEDFRVDEVLGFEPDGQGEHLFWLIQKTGMSTPELARHLSSSLGIPLRSITWSGLKDKQAVTTQWIGLHIGVHNTPSPDRVNTETVKVLKSIRNSRKLRNGVHRGNRFILYLRGCSGSHEQLENRLEQIRTYGVPNYFGPQRFGNDGANVHRALDMFTGERRPGKRTERSILLSAARSWVFNKVLSQRVTDKCWYSLLDGDVMQLHGSQICFTPDWNDTDTSERHALEQRVLSGDIYVTGPLWGAGKPAVSARAGLYEDRENLPADLCQGLERAGLKQERRALALRPANLTVEPASEGGLMIEFELARSGYATAVLRELVALDG